MAWNFVHFAAAALTGAAVVCPLCLETPASSFTFDEHVNTAATSAAEADTARVQLTIKGMTCASCATTARIALERSEGVYRAEVSYDSASAWVAYDPERTSPPAFIASLKKLTGYDAAVARKTANGERS